MKGYRGCRHRVNIAGYGDGLGRLTYEQYGNRFIEQTGRLSVIPNFNNGAIAGCNRF